MPKVLPGFNVTFYCSCLAKIAKCLWNRILTRRRCILSIFGLKNARIALQSIRVYSEQRALHSVFCIFLCCIVYCVFWEWAGTETGALESRKMSQMCRSAMMQAFSPSSCFMRSYKMQIRFVREKQQKNLRQDSVAKVKKEISQLYDVNIKSGQKYELCWYFFMTRVWKILFNRALFHCRPDRCSKRLKVLRFSFSSILENTTYWEVLGEKGKDRCGDVSLWWLLSKEYKEWAKLGGIVRIIYPKELP